MFHLDFYTRMSNVYIIIPPQIGVMTRLLHPRILASACTYFPSENVDLLRRKLLLTSGTGEKKNSEEIRLQLRFAHIHTSWLDA